jgi:hypothetical protein
MSLNKQLFDVPKANDALLLMTILSTDLKSLKRRGYNSASEIVDSVGQTLIEIV